MQSFVFVLHVFTVWLASRCQDRYFCRPGDFFFTVHGIFWALLRLGWQLEHMYTSSPIAICVLELDCLTAVCIPFCYYTIMCGLSNLDFTYKYTSYCIFEFADCWNSVLHLENLWRYLSQLRGTCNHSSWHSQASQSGRNTGIECLQMSRNEFLKADMLISTPWQMITIY